jgi:hypothetical protein
VPQGVNRPLPAPVIIPIVMDPNSGYLGREVLTLTSADETSASADPR